MKTLPPPSNVITNCPAYSPHPDSNKYAIFLAAGYQDAIVPLAEKYFPSTSVLSATEYQPALSNLREIPAMLNYPVLFHKLAIEYLKRLKCAEKDSDEYQLMNKKAEWAIDRAKSVGENEWRALHAVHLYLIGDEATAKSEAQAVLRENLPYRRECELLLDMFDRDQTSNNGELLEVEPDMTKIALGVVLCFLIPLLGIYILYKERKERKNRALLLQAQNYTTYVTDNTGEGTTSWSCPVPDSVFPFYLLEPEPSSIDAANAAVMGDKTSYVKTWWSWYDRNQKFICHERINNWAILKEKVLAGDESAKFMMNALGFTMESHNNGIAVLGNPINEQAGLIQNLVAYWVPYELV